MDDQPERRGTLIVAWLLLGGAFLAGLFLLTGGQVSRVLSTVGGSVTTGSSSGGGSDTTDTSNGSQPDPVASPGSGSGSGGAGQVADAGAVVPTLLIVRTGQVTLQVADLDAALRNGDAAVLRANGYISASSRTSDAHSDVANVAYRIPSVAWTSTLDALHGLAAKVVDEQIKTEEVSGQVVDLTAHIANLRATEAALQAIMARATKISDVLDVQGQLTTTRGEIEKLVADKTQLEDRASYGSLAVTYRLPVVPTPTATPLPAKGWDPGDDVARASGKLVKIGQTTTSIGIWLAIVGLPLAIGGLILVFVGWQVYRLGRWVVRRRDAALEQAA